TSVTKHGPEKWEPVFRTRPCSKGLPVLGSESVSSSTKDSEDADERFLREQAGRGFSLRDDGRTRPHRPTPVGRERTQPPGIGASGIHRGAKPVLQCLWFGRKAFRRYGRTATEARVRSLQWVVSFSG